MARSGPRDFCVVRWRVGFNFAPARTFRSISITTSAYSHTAANRAKSRIRPLPFLWTLRKRAERLRATPCIGAAPSISRFGWSSASPAQHSSRCGTKLTQLRPCENTSSVFSPHHHRHHHHRHHHHHHRHHHHHHHHRPRRPRRPRRPHLAGRTGTWTTVGMRGRVVWAKAIAMGTVSARAGCSAARMWGPATDSRRTTMCAKPPQVAGRTGTWTTVGMRGRVVWAKAIAMGTVSARVGSSAARMWGRATGSGPTTMCVKPSQGAGQNGHVDYCRD